MYQNLQLSFRRKTTVRWPTWGLVMQRAAATLLSSASIASAGQGLSRAPTPTTRGPTAPSLSSAITAITTPTRSPTTRTDPTTVLATRSSPGESLLNSAYLSTTCRPSRTRGRRRRRHLGRRGGGPTAANTERAPPRSTAPVRRTPLIRPTAGPTRRVVRSRSGTARKSSPTSDYVAYSASISVGH